MTPLLILSGKFEFILLPLKICDGYLKTDKDCLEEWIEMKRQNLKLTRSQTAINRNINFFCPFLVIYFLQICSIFFLLTFNHYSSYVSAMPILKNLLWVDVWTKRWECVSICSIALGRIIFLGRQGGSEVSLSHMKLLIHCGFLPIILNQNNLLFFVKFKSIVVHPCPTNIFNCLTIIIEKSHLNLVGKYGI